MAVLATSLREIGPLLFADAAGTVAASVTQESGGKPLGTATSGSKAADVTGTWKVEFNTQIGVKKYTFTLKQEGTTVIAKATVELNDEQAEVELTKGKIDGGTVSFVEMLNLQGNETQITFTGKISGDEIAFTREVAEFGSTTGTASREEANLLHLIRRQCREPLRRPLLTDHSRREATRSTSWRFWRAY